MNTTWSIPKPRTPHSPAVLPILAGLPAAINIALALSPSFSNHPSLRVVAVISGFLASALVFRMADRHEIAIGGMFAIVGLSHLYVITSASVADHLSRINIMGEMIDIERALWSCFIFAAIGLAVLIRDLPRKIASMPDQTL